MPDDASTLRSRPTLSGLTLDVALGAASAIPVAGGVASIANNVRQSYFNASSSQTVNDLLLRQSEQHDWLEEIARALASQVQDHDNLARIVYDQLASRESTRGPRWGFLVAGSTALGDVMRPLDQQRLNALQHSPTVLALNIDHPDDELFEIPIAQVGSVLGHLAGPSRTLGWDAANADTATWLLKESSTLGHPGIDKVEDWWDETPRNAPCPCGSGKKYKQCHEGRSVGLVARPLAAPQGSAVEAAKAVARRIAAANGLASPTFEHDAGVPVGYVRTLDGRGETIFVKQPVNVPGVTLASEHGLLNYVSFDDDGVGWKFIGNGPIFMKLDGRLLATLTSLDGLETKVVPFREFKDEARRRGGIDLSHFRRKD